MPQTSDTLDPLDFATPATLGVTASNGKWIAARHLLHVDRALCDVIARRVPQSIVTIEAPPRHGKSVYVSKYTTAWSLLTRPSSRVMLTSYGATIARTWGREVRDVIRQFGPAFGINVRRDVSAANLWRIVNHDGGMMTAGVGGPVTGHGADLLIVDDYLKNAEQALSERVRDSHWQWFQSTAWTRLEPGGTCVVMATRWHEDDLIGRLHRHAETELGVSVLNVHLPALAEANDELGRDEGDPLWPELRPLSWLMQQKTMLDAYWFNALFQQRPSQYGAAEWPDAYFASPFWVDDDDWPRQFDLSVVAVDPSKGTSNAGDYCAIVHLGLVGGVLYVDAIVERLPVTEIVLRTIAVHEATASDRVGFESNGFQSLIATEFARVLRVMNAPPAPLALVNNQVNKHLRISRLGPYLAQHALRFRTSSGTKRLVSQLKAFPNGDHDDGPDALEMAIRLLSHVAKDSDRPNALRATESLLTA